MKKLILLLILPFMTMAQSTLITPGNGQPNILSSSTNNSIVASRMTYNQIAAILNPTIGTLVYDTDFKTYRFWNGTRWVSMASPCVEGCSMCDMPGTSTGNNFFESSAQIFNPKRVVSRNSSNEFHIATNSSVVKYSRTGAVLSTLPTTFNAVNVTVKNDLNNNTYIAGYSIVPPPNPTYSGFPLVSPPTGSMIIFLVKFNSAGVIQWVQSGYKTNQLEFSMMMDFDASGNIFMAGNFDNTLWFGGNTYTTGGGQDSYLVKFDANGNLLNSQTFGGAGNQNVTSLKVDASNDVYLGGSFSSSVVIGATMLTTTNTSEGFLAKFANNGTNIYAVSTGGVSVEDIAFDNTAFVFVGGGFTGILGSLTASGYDIYVAKYNKSDGTLVTRNKFGGSGNETLSGMIMKNNNLYLTGNYTGTSTTFSNFNSTGNLSGQYTGFVSKVNTSLQTSWIKSLVTEGNGYLAPTASYGYSILDGGFNGGIYVFVKYLINAAGGGSSCIKCLTTGDLCSLPNNYSSGAYAILRFVE